MNIQTINYIAKIAGFAADQMACNAFTLKQAREYIDANMKAETAQYVDVDGVDFDRVHGAVWQLTTFTRKAQFSQFAGDVVRRCNESRDELALNTRVAHVINRAKDAGMIVTASQVLATSVAQSDIHFSVSACVAELAEEANKPAQSVSVQINRKITFKKPLLSAVALIVALSSFAPSVKAADQWSAIFSDVQNAFNEPTGANYLRAQEILNRRLGETFSIEQMKNLAGLIANHSITQWDINSTVISKLGNSEMNKNVIPAALTVAMTALTPAAHAISTQDFNSAYSISKTVIVSTNDAETNYNAFVNKFTTYVKDSLGTNPTPQEIRRAATNAGFKFDNNNKVISDQFHVAPISWTALTPATPAKPIILTAPTPVVAATAQPTTANPVGADSDTPTAKPSQPVAVPAAQSTPNLNKVTPVITPAAVTAVSGPKSAADSDTPAQPVSKGVSMKTALSSPAPIITNVINEPTKLVNNTPVKLNGSAHPTNEHHIENAPTQIPHAVPVVAPVVIPVAQPTAKPTLIEPPKQGYNIPKAQVMATALTPALKAPTPLPYATPVKGNGSAHPTNEHHITTAPTPIAQATPIATPAPLKAPTVNPTAYREAIKRDQAKLIAPSKVESVTVPVISKLSSTPAYQPTLTSPTPTTTTIITDQPTAKAVDVVVVKETAVNGKDGKNGVDGKPGAMGKTGATGAQGVAGKDAANPVVNNYYRYEVKQSYSQTVKVAQVDHNTQQINKLNNNFNNLKQTVDSNKKIASAGSASAMAQANIPQVLNGQTVAFGAGVGGYDGENAVAVGVSFRASESVTVKATVSDDTQNNFGYGAGVSIGY